MHIAYLSWCTCMSWDNLSILILDPYLIGWEPSIYDVGTIEKTISPYILTIDIDWCIIVYVGISPYILTIYESGINGHDNIAKTIQFSNYHFDIEIKNLHQFVCCLYRSTMLWFLLTLGPEIIPVYHHIDKPCYFQAYRVIIFTPPFFSFKR